MFTTLLITFKTPTRKYDLYDRATSFSDEDVTRIFACFGRNAVHWNLKVTTTLKQRRRQNTCSYEHFSLFFCHLSISQMCTTCYDTPYIKIIHSDVRPSADNVPMKIHLSPFVDQLCQITMTLVSVNGNERRVYKVSFLRV